MESPGVYTGITDAAVGGTAVSAVISFSSIMVSSLLSPVNVDVDVDVDVDAAFGFESAPAPASAS